MGKKTKNCVFIRLFQFGIRFNCSWMAAVVASVQQFVGSSSASGLGVCSGSESTLNSRSLSTYSWWAKWDPRATKQTKPIFN